MSTTVLGSMRAFAISAAPFAVSGASPSWDNPWYVSFFSCPIVDSSIFLFFSIETTYLLMVDSSSLNCSPGSSMSLERADFGMGGMPATAMDFVSSSNLACIPLPVLPLAFDTRPNKVSSLLSASTDTVSFILMYAGLSADDRRKFFLASSFSKSVAALLHRPVGDNVPHGGLAYLELHRRRCDVRRQQQEAKGPGGKEHREFRPPRAGVPCDPGSHPAFTVAFHLFLSVSSGWNRIPFLLPSRAS